MDTEIELKFFVSPDIAIEFTKKIAEYNILRQSTKVLSNTYFDTPDHQLRAMDAGLRIRHVDDLYVQTLKIAGRVVAGLHQRPEFNNNIDSNTPNLSLINKEAWPKHTHIDELQKTLIPLFDTNFTRKLWLVNMPDGSDIEVVFDQGKVMTSDQSTPISEIELELKSGQVGALFTLAREISVIGNMRLGNVSKAARGYRLADHYTPGPLKELPFMDVDKKGNIEDAFAHVLEQALVHWHISEQYYFETRDMLALNQISQVIRFIRHLFTIYSGLIPRRSSMLLRQELQWVEDELSWVPEALHIRHVTMDKGDFLKKLDARKKLVKHLKKQLKSYPDEKKMNAFFTSSRYTCLLLDLNRWLVTKGWQPFLDKKNEKKLAKQVKPFADKVLKKSWEELMAVFPEEQKFSRQDYLDQWPRLNRNLLTGRCFATLYDDESRSAFRLPWLDVMRGIEDLQVLAPLHNLIDKVEDEDEQKQFVKWLIRKEEYLLHAIDQTRHNSIGLTPYWY